eukprot:PhM_4_TR18860/c0_g1_i3/m.19091
MKRTSSCSRAPVGPTAPRSKSLSKPKLPLTGASSQKRPPPPKRLPSVSSTSDSSARTNSSSVPRKTYRSSSVNLSANNSKKKSLRPVVSSIAGPILFTAPHGRRLYRGGGEAGKRRLHLREQYSSEIALILAQTTGEALYRRTVLEHDPQD